MSELFPAKTIGLIYASCDGGANEYAFNHWYNSSYVSGLLSFTGIDNVYRYANASAKFREGQSRYLTILRLHSHDPWDLVLEATRRAGTGPMAENLSTDWITVWEFLAYRRTVSPPLRPETHLPDGMPEAMLVVPTVCTDPDREEEFRHWYLHTHFHDLLETPGVVQAHRYKSLNPKPEPGESNYLALYEIDADDPNAVTRRILQDDRDVRIPQGRMIDCIQAPNGLGTYQHIDI